MAFSHLCETPLKMVSEGEIQRIHEASLQVLEEAGVRFADDVAVSFLEDHGCLVDHESQIVKFPPALVLECLQKCPPQFTLRARNRKYDIVFRTNNVHFAACSGMEVLELDTLKRRPGTLADAEGTARLCDALDNMAGANTGLGYLADKPMEIGLEWIYATALRNSAKVSSVGVMDDSEIWGIRMAQAVGQDVVIVVSSASPLGWTKDQIVGVRRAIDAGLPVGFQSMASPGTTAPATLAGTAVLMNVEILAMMVLAQLLKPGTGVMYSCFTIPLDMQTATLASGSMELGMMTVISAQLSRFYGMGSIIFSPMSDSKLFDEQVGYEKAMQWLLAGMAGINLIWGSGNAEGHTLWSNAQLVVDAEMCGMVGRYLEGVPVDDARLAVDLIKDVGHFPKTYLDTRHTRDWWRSERYRPLVSSREAYDRWVQMGSRDVLARADEKARELLKTHHVDPLPEPVDRELDSLLQAAAKEKGVAFS